MQSHQIARQSIAVFAAILSGLGLVPAQERQYSLASTLRYYETCKEREESGRYRCISQLGGFDDPRVTEILTAELKRAKMLNYRIAVLRSLGQRQRADILEIFTEILDTQPQDYRLRSTVCGGIARQGDAGLDDLLSRLSKLKADRLPSPQYLLKQSILQSLPLAKSERAFDAIAQHVSTGAAASRSFALIQLRNAPPGPSVTKTRIAASKSTDLALAAEATRQLAMHGTPGTKALTLALNKKALDKVAGTVHAALLEALSYHLDSDTYGAFITRASFSAPEVDATLKRISERIRNNVAFTEWLIERGLKLRPAGERSVAIRLLAEIDHEGVTNALLPLLKSRETEIVYSVIRSLGRRGDAMAIDALRSLMKKSKGERRIESMHGLHMLLVDDPAWKAELMPMLGSRDIATQITAMDLLAGLQATEALATVHKLLDHRVWQVRAAAYDFCRTVRSINSIPKLFDRVDHEKGRLRDDALDALENLTQLRLLSAAQWQRWWSHQSDRFTLPEPPAEGKSSRPPAAGGTVSYYSLTISSSRVAFIIDHSGSMSAKMSTGGTTRMEEAKRQLSRVVEQIPAKTHFNILFFGNGVKNILKKLTAANPKTKKKALGAVKGLTPTGSTNIHDALEAAFADPEVDTIYLLSDGYPSAGKIRDPNLLADAVARWNRSRRIRIHTIAVGSTSPMLQRLSSESGARHVLVK